MMTLSISLFYCQTTTYHMERGRFFFPFVAHTDREWTLEWDAMGFCP
jgi:hypothetical protein